jgi:hypothetical protein
MEIFNSLIYSLFVIFSMVIVTTLQYLFYCLMYLLLLVQYKGRRTNA